MIDESKLVLYAITDGALIGGRGRDLCGTVEQALLGGVKIIQLRDKGAEHDELVRQAKALRPLCRKYGAYLIVNDDWQAAAEAGAHGVHVGASDDSVSKIRRQLGSGFIIGATAKTVEQAQRAESEGADYLGSGALFPSPTKANAVPLTKEGFRSIAASVKIPVVAIGGIDRSNISTLAGIGAAGFAVVSAVFGGSNVRKDTEELLRRAKSIVES